MAYKLNNSEIVTIDALAQRLRLPVAFLQRETKANRIPYLKAGNRVRYNPAAVRAALAVQASINPSDEGKQ